MPQQNAKTGTGSLPTTSTGAGGECAPGADAADFGERLALLRIVGALPNLLGVVVITFLLTRALPGDPAAYFAGQAAAAGTRLADTAAAAAARGGGRGKGERLRRASAVLTGRRRWWAIAVLRRTEQARGRPTHHKYVQARVHAWSACARLAKLLEGYMRQL